MTSQNQSLVLTLKDLKHFKKKKKKSSRVHGEHVNINKGHRLSHKSNIKKTIDDVTLYY